MSSFAKLSLLFAAMFVCLGQKPAVGQNVRSDGEILRPEAAFPYELNASSNELTIRFQIPEGYYLYRERFEFESSTPGISLGEPRFQKAKSTRMSSLERWRSTGVVLKLISPISARLDWITLRSQ